MTRTDYVDDSLEKDAVFWIEGILTPIVSIAGVFGEFKKDYLNLNIFIHKTENFERNILGNIICIWVLTKKKKELGLKPSFTNLLILLVSLVTSP